jgi:hypothetical protein
MKMEVHTLLPTCCPATCWPAPQVNANDTVCTVPRLMGYAHVGHAIQLMGSGEAEVEMHTTEKLGEGVGLPDVAPAVTAMVAAKVSIVQFWLCPARLASQHWEVMVLLSSRAGWAPAPSPQFPPALPARCCLCRYRSCCRMWRPKR